MAKKTEFFIGTIMTVVTGRRMCSDESFYELLEFMNGGSPVTDMPALRRACAEHLVVQHPWLRTIPWSLVDRDNIHVWVKSLIRQHGQYHEVKQLPN